MTTAIALGQLKEFARRIGDADWSRPTALPGWDVAELARHVTAVAWMQAEAFHRARLGIEATPSWATVGAEPGDLPALLDDAYAHLESALARLDGEPTVPLPFAPMPASIAVPVLVLEYGVHLADLRQALDGAPALDPEAADVVMQLLPLWMPLAGTATDNGTSIAVGDIAFRYEDGWQPTTDAACTVIGEPSALALFALGRIGADHPSLTVDGDAGVAKRFKELFPGP